MFWNCAHASAHKPGNWDWGKTGNQTDRSGIGSRTQMPALFRKEASAGFIIIIIFFSSRSLPWPPFESLPVKIQENLTKAETKNVSLEPRTIWKKHKISPCLGAARTEASTAHARNVLFCLAPSGTPDASNYVSFGEISCITGVRTVPEANFK